MAARVEHLFEVLDRLIAIRNECSSQIFAECDVGEMTVKQIAYLRAIDGHADVIIVGRGGGSFEDLFPFNHPDVVRAVAACRTPVISAVGHEVDTALCDFAADLRAPTPSAAAERAVPDRQEVLREVYGYQERMQSLLLHRVRAAGEEVGDLRERMHPRRLARRVNERMQRLAEHDDLLRRAAAAALERKRAALAEVRADLAGRNPLAVLEETTHDRDV